MYKKLAGHTIVYGFGTIIPRILNYVILTAYYTRLFKVEQFGIITELYAYVAFLLIILTYGTETGYFKFSQNDDKNIVYSSLIGSLLFTSLIFIIIVIIFSRSIAVALEYEGNAKYIRIMAVIVAIDAFSAIPFAKLRKEERSKKFTLLKITNVLITIVAVLFFYEILPWIQKVFFAITDSKIRDDVYYVFVSNLIASGAVLLFLLPDIVKTKIKIEWKILTEVLSYSFPLLIAGLAGTVNEALDRILLKHLVENTDKALYILGIYGANYRIAMLVYVFIQMFRYAVEPFYFNYQGKPDEKEVYARIMRLFIGVVIIMCMIIMFYLKYIKFFIPIKYHEGLRVIPVILVSFVFYGVFYNQSIWYKLTRKTGYAILLTITGAVVTIIINVFFVKKYSYMASAYGHLFAYLIMMLLSYFIGKNYYKINYKMKRIFEYVTIALAIFAFRFVIIKQGNYMTDILSFLMISIYAFYILKREKLITLGSKNG